MAKNIKRCERREEEEEKELSNEMFLCFKRPHQEHFTHTHTHTTLQTYRLETTQSTPRLKKTYYGSHI